MPANNVGFQHICLVQSEQRTKESWWGRGEKPLNKICIPSVLSGGKILART